MDIYTKCCKHEDMIKYNILTSVVFYWHARWPWLGMMPISIKRWAYMIKAFADSSAWAFVESPFVFPCIWQTLFASCIQSYTQTLPLPYPTCHPSANRACASSFAQAPHRPISKSQQWRAWLNGFPAYFGKCDRSRECCRILPILARHRYQDFHIQGSLGKMANDAHLN